MSIYKTDIFIYFTDIKQIRGASKAPRTKKTNIVVIKLCFTVIKILYNRRTISKTALA